MIYKKFLAMVLSFVMVFICTLAGVGQSKVYADSKTFNRAYTYVKMAANGSLSFYKFDGPDGNFYSGETAVVKAELPNAINNETIIFEFASESGETIPATGKTIDFSKRIVTAYVEIDEESMESGEWTISNVTVYKKNGDVQFVYEYTGSALFKVADTKPSEPSDTEEVDKTEETEEPTEPIEPEEPDGPEDSEESEKPGVEGPDDSKSDPENPGIEETEEPEEPEEPIEIIPGDDEVGDEPIVPDEPIESEEPSESADDETTEDEEPFSPDDEIKPNYNQRPNIVPDIFGDLDEGGSEGNETDLDEKSIQVVDNTPVVAPSVDITENIEPKPVAEEKVTPVIVEDIVTPLAQEPTKRTESAMEVASAEVEIQEVTEPEPVFTEEEISEAPSLALEDVASESVREVAAMPKSTMKRYETVKDESGKTINVEIITIGSDALASNKNGEVCLSSLTVRKVKESLKSADMVRIEMGGACAIAGDIFTTARDLDVTIEIRKNGYYWTIDSKDIGRKVPESINFSVNLDVDTIPENLIASVAGGKPVRELELGHDGKFGMKTTLTINVGSESRDLYANLYYYNPKGKLEFQNTAKVNPDGSVSWDFKHASSYAIVLGADATPNHALVVTSLIAVNVIAVVGAVVVSGRKRKKFNEKFK